MVDGYGTTVLCVEDDPHLRRDIRDELAAAGYRTISASDGIGALSALETARPDLILCDITMPGLDGYALLDTIRCKRPDLADVPFIFLTALSARDEIIRGKRAAADDYLVKPIDYDLMLATIEARLEQMYRVDAMVERNLDELRGALDESRSGERAGLRRVLDLLSFGVVLIADAEVVFANRAARAVHETGDGLSIGRTLRTGSSALNRSIDCHLAGACAAAVRGEDSLASLTVPRLSGRRDLLLMICALSQSPEARSGDAQAVVFIADPERRTRAPASALAQLFDLTPTEAKVAFALAHGRRTGQIADDLGVSQTTIAFHLRNLFEKTDTNRQSDLITLLLTGLGSFTFD
jgi:DNA-binding NarL/FixJ family response regulator